MLDDGSEIGEAAVTVFGRGVGMQIVQVENGQGADFAG
jgi:hypothetical protein